MLLRKVRAQLAVFTVLTVVSVSTVLFGYLDLRYLFGFGEYQVTAEFTDATGLYPGATVSYRGVEAGKVRAVELGEGTAIATLGIHTDVQVPAKVRAAIRGQSAIGEQSVDLTPQRGGGPWLRDGDRIPAADTTGMPRTDELITSLSDLAASLPPAELSVLLDELTTGFQGQGPNVTTLLEATRTVLHRADDNLEPTIGLIHELQAFLATQRELAGTNRDIVADLAAFSAQLRASDADIRAVLDHTPPAVTGAVDLQHRVAPALPQLLTDLNSTGAVIRTQLPGVSQVFVLYPAVTAAVQRVVQQPWAAPGSARLGIRSTVNDPPPCYTGYTPMEQQRGFGDLSQAPPPQDQYCKVAADDPRAIRGTRNYPCAANPAVRAAHAADCPDPALANPAEVTGAYDPVTGNAMLPDGHLYLLGDVAQHGSGEEPRTWQQLLVK